MPNDQTPSPWPEPVLIGGWMVVGPNFPDGSGWSLCQHKDAKCHRCVAEFTEEADALNVARLLSHNDVTVLHMVAVHV